MKYALALTAFTLCPAVAAAFSPDALRPEAEFDTWSVLCDSLDDMGGVTYLSCAATPTEGVYIRETDAGGVLVVFGDATIGGIETTPCEWGQCSAPLSHTAFLAAFDAGVTVGGTALSAAGLGDALAEMARLLR